MEAEKLSPINDAVNYKPRKKQQPLLQSPGDTAKLSDIPSKKGPKAPKRSHVNDVSPLSSQERSIPDSVADSLTSGNDYRTLRRKYLMLEEESSGLERELKEVENDVKTLEEEKESLLDELVVLEGLVDPSETRPQG